MNDDNNWARSVLAEPELGPEPVSTVDVMLAMRQGRRRVRARGATMGIAASLLVLAAIPLVSKASPSPVEAQAATFPSKCTVEELVLPRGAVAAKVHDADPSGHYSVGVASSVIVQNDEMIGPGQPHRLVRWDGRTPEIIELPMPGHLVEIAINSSGVVAMTLSRDDERRNWIYRDGAFTELVAPGYAVSGINARGDVVGWFGEMDGAHPPVVWPAGRPTEPRELIGGDTGDGMVVMAAGIDDDGTVAGTVGRLIGNLRTPLARKPVYWTPEGQLHELDISGQADFAQSAVTVGIRGGYVAAELLYPGEDLLVTGNRAMVWNLADGRMTVFDHKLHSFYDVNPHGWVLGQEPGRQGGVYGRLVVLNGSDWTVLPTPGESEVMPHLAKAISDDGRVIAGSLYLEKEGYAPVRWMCR